mmetsp:Transcript_37549/g.90592  ORF Transcript_37549/g.90592 Transcript_37549/m.90592 type:complete len:100 (-) Transcript_37549:777-1076(-)
MSRAGVSGVLVGLVNPRLVSIFVDSTAPHKCYFFDNMSPNMNALYQARCKSVDRDESRDVHSKDIELAITQLGSTSSFDMETEAGQIAHSNGAKQLDQV